MGSEWGGGRGGGPGGGGVGALGVGGWELEWREGCTHFMHSLKSYDRVAVGGVAGSFLGGGSGGKLPSGLYGEGHIPKRCLLIQAFPFVVWLASNPGVS